MSLVTLRVFVFLFQYIGHLPPPLRGVPMYSVLTSQILSTETMRACRRNEKECTLISFTVPFRSVSLKIRHAIYIS